jgi:hypothetical protein
LSKEQFLHQVQVTTDNCNTYYFFVKNSTPWGATVKIHKKLILFKKFISQWIPFVDKYIHNIKLKDSFELEPGKYKNPRIVDVQPVVNEFSSYSLPYIEKAYNELPDD